MAEEMNQQLDVARNAILSTVLPKPPQLAVRSRTGNQLMSNSLDRIIAAEVFIKG